MQIVLALLVTIVTAQDGGLLGMVQQIPQTLSSAVNQGVQTAKSLVGKFIPSLGPAVAPAPEASPNSGAPGSAQSPGAPEAASPQAPSDGFKTQLDLSLN